MTLQRLRAERTTRANVLASGRPPNVLAGDAMAPVAASQDVRGRPARLFWSAALVWVPAVLLASMLDGLGGVEDLIPWAVVAGIAIAGGRSARTSGERFALAAGTFLGMAASGVYLGWPGAAVDGALAVGLVGAGIVLAAAAVVDVLRRRSAAATPPAGTTSSRPSPPYRRPDVDAGGRTSGGRHRRPA
jgi:hypothetical protein